MREHDKKHECNDFFFFFLEQGQLQEEGEENESNP